MVCNKARFIVLFHFCITIFSDPLAAIFNSLEIFAHDIGSLQASIFFFFFNKSRCYLLTTGIAIVLCKYHQVIIYNSDAQLVDPH